MCGRFTQYYTWWQIWEMYNLFPSATNLQPRYNVCPTTTIDTVISRKGKRELIHMRWGLVPSWWKKSLKEMKVATFNARAETVTEKSMFRESFKRRRCLVPVSGYYEWADTPEGKQPYYFTRRDGGTMTIAAIQDGWVDPVTREAVPSCSMVITEPNELVAEVHNRMPVILNVKDFEQWERGDAKDAAALMKPVSEDVLLKWPVSKRVNSSRASDDDSSLIEKVT
jgi:putative SOS response-associated peptidase YedK